jgi:curved DNA-binding protein CbpA
MSKENSYKPRFGFDIRASVTKGSKTAKKSWKKKEVRTCDHEECDSPAEVRAPKSPHRLNEYFWFCPVHARAHNKAWNYFDGKSEKELQAELERARYGDRPTWTMAKNARAASAARASLGDGAEIDDQVGIFTQMPGATAAQEGAYRAGRKLTKLQVSAFKTFNLPNDASSADLRKRYAELVKRFHPDSNAGDRGAEEQLQAVIKAHQILKKAGFC